MGFDDGLFDSDFDDDFDSGFSDGVDDFGSGFSDGVDDYDLDSASSSGDDEDLSLSTWSSDGSADSGDAFTSDGDSGKKDIMKSSIILIIGGLLLLVVVTLLTGLLKGKNDKEPAGENYSGEAVITENDYDSTSDYYDSTSDYVGTTNNDSSSSNSDNNKKDWKKFDSAEEIKFIDEPVNLTFTVTKIDNYVKFVNTSNDMMVKTIATGALDGYSGTYEIELPYNKGSLLKPGAQLLVSVQVGEYKGMSVIGEIVVI